MSPPRCSPTRPGTTARPTARPDPRCSLATSANVPRFGGGVTDVVYALTGTPAESFETTVRHYAALPFAEPTLANKLKALVMCGLTPLYRDYDLVRWDSENAFPVPPAASLSVDDARWRTEHGAPLAPLDPSTAAS